MVKFLLIPLFNAYIDYYDLRNVSILLIFSMTETQNIKYLGNYTINMKAILGKGSTGTVYEGYNVKNNKIVAIKRIDL